MNNLHDTMPESDRQMISRWKKEVNDAYYDTLAKRQVAVERVSTEITSLIVLDSEPFIG